jgi:hypothetical protein
LISPWPANAVAYTNFLVEQGQVSLYESMGLQQAWRVISPSEIKAVIDAVRSRILDLALGVEQAFPEAGQPGATPASPDQINQIITNVFGGSANIAVASTDFDQTIGLPDQGDVDGLIEYLARAGIEPADLEDLKAAVADDAEANQGEGKPKVGARVTSWIGHMAVRSAGAVGKGGAAAIGGVVAKAIAAHYGIHA